MNYTPNEIAELLKDKPQHPHYIAAMVRKAVEAEREMCANLCEQQRFGIDAFGSIDHHVRQAAEQCAAAIRARRYTPGPWILHPTAHHPAVRSIGTPDTGPRRICTVGTMNGNPVDKANARLIAAAPELLEAAIELKDVCNRPAAARTRAEAWRKLDKAIAKALQPNAD